MPEGLWEIVEPLLPAVRVRPQGGGTANIDDEAVFAAIVYVLVSGCSWRHVLPCFGASKSMVHRRFRIWTHAGVWGRLHRAVLDRLAAEELVEVARVLLDSTQVRAKKVPLCLVSSGSGCRLLVEGVVTEHGEQDVDTAAG